MTRRDILLGLGTAAVTVGAAHAEAGGPLLVPIHRVLDSRARCSPAEWRHFWGSLWPEAYGNFSRGGLQLQCTDSKGEIKRSPAGRPIFVGLQPGVLNLVLTDHLPQNWDRGRSGAGVTTRYDGYHICLIAITEAHGNQVPYLSVNTCVHELLHALLGDVFVKRETWYQAGWRETRADWYATRLWLFGDGATLRGLASDYLRRLRGAA